VTGDIDSLSKILEDIRNEIHSFAIYNNIHSKWFNDNVSNLLYDFSTKNDDLFHKLVFNGKSLKLFIPDMKTLLVSKMYPLLDRDADLSDIETLISAKVASKNDYEEALTFIDGRVRYEMDSYSKKRLWELLKILNSLKESLFEDE